MIIQPIGITEGHLEEGFGILASNRLSHAELSLRQYPGGFLETNAVTVNTADCQFAILNLYNPNCDVPVEEFNHYVGQLGSSFLIVGDFNAHSPILTQYDVNSNITGKSLENLLTSSTGCLPDNKSNKKYLNGQGNKKGNKKYICLIGKIILLIFLLT